MKPSVLVATCLTAIAGSACAASLEAGVKKDIEAQMAAAQKPIAFCYESALKKNPELAGKMLVKFRVAETSKVPTFVEVSTNDFKAPELEKCVITETQEVRLSAPPGVPIAVTYPLELSRAKAKAPKK